MEFSTEPDPFPLIKIPPGGLNPRPNDPPLAGHWHTHPGNLDARPSKNKDVPNSQKLKCPSFVIGNVKAFGSSYVQGGVYDLNQGSRGQLVFVTFDGKVYFVKKDGSHVLVQFGDDSQGYDYLEPE